MIVDFDPVAFRVFGWAVHWYGIMYLLSFLSCWQLGRWQARQPNSGWTLEQVDDMLFYVGLGVILGGRIGYILFYSFPSFLADPVILFKVWKGGMSFHGGLIGPLVALWFFSRKYKKRWFETVDFLAVLAPIGLGFGRLGNFINGELWGKPTSLPWGMSFPNSDTMIPRHPNPLYEMLLEGVVMFVVLWWFSRRPRPVMAVSGLFAVLYSVFRIGIEFVRVPDAQLGYLAFGWVTMGQVLSLPLFAVGVLLLWLAYRKPLTTK